MCLCGQQKERRFVFLLLAPLVLAHLLLSINRVSANFLVVLLKRSKVLTSLSELTLDDHRYCLANEKHALKDKTEDTDLLHTLTDVPVDEGTLGVHEIEFVVWFQGAL
jgi:hypothetical protein